MAEFLAAVRHSGIEECLTNNYERNLPFHDELSKNEQLMARYIALDPVFIDFAINHEAD